MNFKLIALLLCLIDICSHVQLFRLDADKTSLCHPPRLPLALDSLPMQRRLALDSVTRLAVGRWRLTEIKGGWSGGSKSSTLIELQLTKQLEGVIIENGGKPSKCRFTLSTRYGYIRTTIDGPGASFFNLSPKVKGSFRVCDQELIISQHLGDGLAFHFRRDI